MAEIQGHYKSVVEVVKVPDDGRSLMSKNPVSMYKDAITVRSG